MFHGFGVQGYTVQMIYVLNMFKSTYKNTQKVY